jgi:hypothetical protein
MLGGMLGADVCASGGWHTTATAVVARKQLCKLLRPATDVLLLVQDVHHGVAFAA